MAIQKETMLRSADNSGALKLKCFHIIGSSRKRLAVVGDLIKCAVKDATPGMTVKKGEVVTCVVVRTKCSYRRKDGSVIRFDDNACVVVEKDKKPKGTRVFGPVARELKDKGYSRIVSLASEVV